MAYAVSRITPGTNLLAFCTAVGWLMRRGPGAAVALVAGSVPSAVAAVALSAFYTSWSEHPLARLALRGVLASAIAIMVVACWTIVRPHLRHPYQLRVILVFVAAFALTSVWGIPPIRVLALSALAGSLWPEEEES